MKKSVLTVALACTLLGSSTLTSCIGSFQLTSKLLNWNKSVGDKFVNELVFVAFWILPVYEISGLADIIVLNSIEFWSGTNPVAKGTKVIDTKDGKVYVKCDGKGYTITNDTDKSVVRLDFDADRQEWSTMIDGERKVFLTFVDDTHVKVPGVNGDMQIVELSQSGVYAYQQSVLTSSYAMK
jgi:hypothetical protein